jgi:hypothetical protein
MFRKSRSLSLGSLCGFLAAVVFFLVGLTVTVHFSRWDPYMKVDWQGFLASLHPNFAGDFILYSFLFDVCIAALFFLLALGSRLYMTHPTSTVAGLGCLGVGVVIAAIYSVWMAFGQAMVLMRYQSTQDEALRQTFQHLYQAGFLDIPVISMLIAYFGFWGFVFLGNAFRNRDDGSGWLTGWCWVSAASFLWAILVLSYGYDRTFSMNQFHRTLMMWGQLGLWVLPTITMGLCAGWIWPQRTAMEQPSAETQPPAAKAA